MPEIEITPEQQERLRELQEEIARDVVGKYGHVRPRDAVEYLLDRYETDETDGGVESSTETVSAPEDADGDADEASGGDDATDGQTEGDATDGQAEGGAAARVVADDAGGDSGGDDDMLNEMMSLLDTHDDKWGESSGDERYVVELPDESTEQVRTKDDVKALLFKHYR